MTDAMTPPAMMTDQVVAEIRASAEDRAKQRAKRVLRMEG